MKVDGLSAHALRLDVAGTITGLQPAGHFVVWPGTQMAALKKPCWLHRTAMRAVFGWKWVDHVAGGAK